MRECKTLDRLAEKFRKHVEKKRRVALEFKDMGKSLQVRSTDLSTDAKPISGDRAKDSVFKKRVFFAKRDQKLNAMVGSSAREEASVRDMEYMEHEEDEPDEDDYDSYNTETRDDPELEDIYQQMEDFEHDNSMLKDHYEEDLRALDVRSHGRPGARPPAGTGDARNLAKTPCYVKFLRGTCDNKNCKHSHDDAVMLKAVMARFRDVARSKFAPDKAYATKLLEKEYEEAAKERSSAQGNASRGSNRA